MRFLTALLLCSSLSLFEPGLTHAAMSDINRIFHQTPQLENLEVCQGGGCAIVSSTNVTEAEWQQVAQIFTPSSDSAIQERERIALAIGKLERIVGEKIGTSNDKAGTFNNSAYTGQQDCNDEAINTTSYMRLLASHGLMLFHTIEDTRTRNFFFTGWPHTTAVIRENETGERYAVDSWFYDNGHPATIVPLTVWKKNYQPDDSPIGKTTTQIH
jgi:hypothetical protein